MMNINIAVVPVAGHGTRLLPATKSQPKEMLPVGRKPGRLCNTSSMSWPSQEFGGRCSSQAPARPRLKTISTSIPN